jgi:hypothetical protein
MQVRAVTKRGVSHALRFRDLVRRERVALRTVPMPLRERLDLWRRGFLSDSGVLYDLADGRHELYVSDLAYALRTPFINGLSNPTLNDKLVFFHTMRSLGAPTPAVLGVVTREGVRRLDGGHGGLREVLEEHGEVVLKPRGGGRGERVSFVALRDGRLEVDGRERARADVEGLLTPGMLLCERVDQGAWARAVFPGATNTMRAMTMWDVDRDEPFVAVTIHRFGTLRSAPVDNVSKGGLSAPVDRETGELGVAISTPRHRALAHHTHHPDTGAPIAGALVPRWPQVREELLALCRRLPYVPYVGWDLVVTEDRWSIIEGNHLPDTQVQAFGPLLADERVRRFYRHHQVV